MSDAKGISAASSPESEYARLADRYGWVLRTPEQPMAFDFGEFARGAGIALLGFQVLFPASYMVITIAAGILSPSGTNNDVVQAFGMGLIALVYSFGYALPWSLGALVLVGGPLAWMLGRALRRVATIWWHLAAFAVLGLAVGASTALAVTSLSAMDGLFLTALGAASTAVAVPFGWWRTASRALHLDRAR